MKLSNKHIYIPSTGRATKQFTWARIPKKYRRFTSIVVPPNEVKEYRKANPGANVIACPEKGIGRTRQWLIDNTDADYILMFDDDLYFFYRVKPMQIALKPCRVKRLKRAIRMLFRWMELDGVKHVGMAPRTEAGFYLCDYRTVTRQNNVHGFDVKFMRKAKRKWDVRFTKLRVMEDFCVTLDLFKHGVPNRVLLDVVWNQPGSNTAGGCSTYRTAEQQRKSAKALGRMHPDVVKVVKKKVVGKTSWEGMKERTDVRIQWRQAYRGPIEPHWIVERSSRRSKVIKQKRAA